MIKTLIIEDEQKSRDVILKIIEKNCPELSVIGTAGNVSEGVEKIKSLKLNLLKNKKNKNPSTLFNEKIVRWGACDFLIDYL